MPGRSFPGDRKRNRRHAPPPLPSRPVTRFVLSRSSHRSPLGFQAALRVAARLIEFNSSVYASDKGHGHTVFMNPVDSSSSMKLVSMNSSALRPLALGLPSARRLNAVSTALRVIFGILFV